MGTNGTGVLVLVLAATACGSHVDGEQSVGETASAASGPSAGGDPCSGFTTIDVPASFNATGTEIYGNSETAVTGDYFDNTPAQLPHGFVATRGTFTPIEPANAVFSQVNGVNAPGNLLGTYFDGSAGRFFAFFFQNGTFTLLNPPSGVRSVAGSLNAGNTAVGTYRKSDQIRRAFVWSNGSYITIDHPLAAPLPGRHGGTEGDGINDLGEVTGSYIDATGRLHGYLFQSGTFTAVDAPAATDTVAQAISDSGVIAGYFFSADGNEHGFVLNQGTYTTIDVPGAASTQVNTINQSGTLGGIFVGSNGVSHGFTASCH